MATQSNAAKETSVVPKKGKNKGQISPKSLQVPPAAKVEPDALTAFVASQQAKPADAAPPVPPPAAPVVEPTLPPAPPARRVQNGQGEYSPDTIGAKIWVVADKLQQMYPNTPVNAAAVRLALPEVAKASVTAGLSHWRRFHGKLRVKGATVAPTPTPAETPAPKPDTPAA